MGGSYKPPRLLFLCDAGLEIGLGHLMRCCELSQALKRQLSDFTPAFFGEFSDKSQQILKSFGFPFYPPTQIPDNSPLFVDKYNLPESFYHELNNKGIKWCAFADDQSQFSQGAAGIVNFRLDAEKHYQYKGAENVFLGVPYFPFSEKLQKLRKKNLKRNNAISNILICLGGVDLFGLSRVLADKIHGLFPDAKITVIDPCLDKKESKGMIDYYPLQTSLIPFMEKTDFAISGGGRIKYELAYAAIPSMILSQVPIQDIDTKIFENYGLCLNLGEAELFDKNSLNFFSKEFIEAFARKMKEQSDQVFHASNPDYLSGKIAELLF